MNHSVTVTRVTHTNTTSAIFINVGYLKSGPGILKLIELVNIIFFFLPNVKMLFKATFQFIDFECRDFWSACKQGLLYPVRRESIIFKTDVDGILDLHILLVTIMCNFSKHWWINFKDALCES